MTAGLSFGEAEMAGWDECAPTIDPCTVLGRQLPDHGDAWDAEWIDKYPRVVLLGSSWPYELERTIGESPTGGIRLSYSARATAGDVPFLWAAHPQFIAPPGTRIELADDVTQFVDVLARPHEPVPRTADLTSIDSVARGGFRKVYVDSEAVVRRVDLVLPDRARLRLSWSDEAPYLGLWFDIAPTRAAR